VVGVSLAADLIAELVVSKGPVCGDDRAIAEALLGGDEAGASQGKEKNVELHGGEVGEGGVL
jgi:hypothetical protein